MTIKNVLTITISLFIVANIHAQTDEQKQMAEAIKITGGGTFFKPRIMPALSKLALAQVTVDFKTVSTKSVTKVEKKQGLFGKQVGSAATASITTYLETSDGELETSDYQEIADHFYRYFQHKLKVNNIDTVGWEKITATDFYKDSDKEKSDDEEEKKKGNAWVSYSAHKGNQLFNGKTGFAFMKGKKAGKMCDEVEAPIAFIHATVDFAELDVDVKISSPAYKSTWTPNANNTTSFDSKSKVSAIMRVAATLETGFFSMLVNEKMHQENITLNEPVPADTDYATEMVKDPSRAEKRSKVFAISLSKKMESTPVVVSTSKEKYKAAAKAALERYADTFVAKAVVLKKD